MPVIPKLSVPVGEYPPPEALSTPDAGPQAFELHDLAVVHKQIDFRTVVLDIPCEYVRIGSLEHHLFKPQRIDELRGDPRFARRSRSP